MLRISKKNASKLHIKRAVAICNSPFGHDKGIGMLVTLSISSITHTQGTI